MHSTSLSIFVLSAIEVQKVIINLSRSEPRPSGTSDAPASKRSSSRARIVPKRLEVSCGGKEHSAEGGAIPSLLNLIFKRDEKTRQKRVRPKNFWQSSLHI